MRRSAVPFGCEAKLAQKGESLGKNASRLPLQSTITVFPKEVAANEMKPSRIKQNMDCKREIQPHQAKQKREPIRVDFTTPIGSFFLYSRFLV